MSADFEWPIPGRRVKPDDSIRFDLELVRRYAEGASIRGLAKQSGWSYGTIQRRLGAAGVKFRERGGARIGAAAGARAEARAEARKEFAKKVVSLYCPPGSVPVREIAVRTGRSQSYIYRILNEANVISSEVQRRRLLRNGVLGDTGAVLSDGQIQEPRRADGTAE
ncbi:helix-turn-helix domain-containing protein [Streptomyces albidoflavus]|nr:helix-turn-helix domain-containing protein [Streptomyces albidoflavus]